MSILSDVSIRALGASLVSPFDPERVQPASYDLTLHEEVLLPVINPSSMARDVEHVTMSQSGFKLLPGSCLLGSTSERIHIPNDMTGRVEGKSTIGRMFVLVHCSAGFLDPGFNGEVTLEIVNVGPWRVLLRPGMPIAQVNFTRLDQPCERPYGSPGLGSHYQGQRGPTAGRQ